MSDKQYAYRYYDSGDAYIGPLPREQVLAKLHEDLSTIPLERHRLTGDDWSAWGLWVESRELLEIFLAAEGLPGLPPVDEGDFPQVSDSVTSTPIPPQETG
jgi:hypothetical protein